MNFGTSTISPPDPSSFPSEGPIDAVVTWVDGSDPAFVARHARFARQARRECGALARTMELRFQVPRYVHHDEIRYCVRSILNHAPWIRTLWLVTDRQFPAAFDRDRLDPRIRLVSHATLYRDLPGARPVFNSSAIETMLCRIPGLADRFVYFNDDMCLTRPTAPEDFFAGAAPVLRGRWFSLPAESPESWLQRRARSAARFGFGTDRFFLESHTPYSLSRPMIAALAAAAPDVFEANARMRFRAATGDYVVALHHHAWIACDRAIIDLGGPWLVYGNYPTDAPAKEMTASLARLATGRYISACLNNLGQYVAHRPDVYNWLDAATGPPLACER